MVELGRAAAAWESPEAAFAAHPELA